MGLLDSLGLAWKPRDGIIYTYKRWHRRKNLVWHPPMAQGQDVWPEGTRSQNLSKVYVVIDEKPHLGTFRVSKGICTLGVVRHKHVEQLYKTNIDNMKFWKKDTGTSRVHPRFGNTTNITHHYEYIAKVLDSNKLVKEKPPKQIVRRRGTAIIDTPEGILVVSGRRKLFILPGGGAEHEETREKATMREIEEETGLKVISSEYLFTHHDPKDRKIRNLHKVFLVKVKGRSKADGHEVKYIAYWKPDSDLNISNTTKLLIKKYYETKANKNV